MFPRTRSRASLKLYVLLMCVLLLVGVSTSNGGVCPGLGVVRIADEIEKAGSAAHLAVQLAAVAVSASPAHPAGAGSDGLHFHRVKNAAAAALMATPRKNPAMIGGTTEAVRGRVAMMIGSGCPLRSWAALVMRLMFSTLFMWCGVMVCWLMSLSYKIRRCESTTNSRSCPENLLVSMNDVDAVRHRPRRGVKAGVPCQGKQVG
jgi:hypothetical protein